MDYSHANSVFVEPGSGAFWLSFRHLFAVARFTGSPGSGGFGALEQLIVGDPESPVVGRATLALRGGPDADFTGQHDANRAPDGSLLLLDNGWLRDRNTEVSRYALDEAAGEVTLLDRWDTGSRCAFQGAARPLDSGNAPPPSGRSGPSRAPCRWWSREWCSTWGGS